MDILDSIDERATLIGAVNTVRIIKENDTTHLKGYNTDCIGFDKSITPLLKSYHDKALVLGTGGSSKAVAFVLRHKGIDVKMVSRNAAGHALSYDELSPEIMEAYKIIINCTPVGMFPAVSAFPEIPYHLLGERHLLFDLIYNPDETVFLKNGKIKNATVKNGYEMLCLQAEASWQIWNTMD